MVVGTFLLLELLGLVLPDAVVDLVFDWASDLLWGWVLPPLAVALAVPAWLRPRILFDPQRGEARVGRRPAVPFDQISGPYVRKCRNEQGTGALYLHEVYFRLASRPMVLAYFTSGGEAEALANELHALVHGVAAPASTDPEVDTLPVPRAARRRGLWLCGRVAAVITAAALLILSHMPWIWRQPRLEAYTLEEGRRVMNDWDERLQTVRVPWQLGGAPARRPYVGVHFYGPDVIFIDAYLDFSRDPDTTPGLDPSRDFHNHVELFYFFARGSLRYYASNQEYHSRSQGRYFGISPRCRLLLGPGGEIIDAERPPVNFPELFESCEVGEVRQRAATLRETAVRMRSRFWWITPRWFLQP
jgi:hypothetical protein